MFCHLEYRPCEGCNECAYPSQKETKLAKEETKMQKRNVVIMNEQHSLNNEQKQILEEKFENYEMLLVPASGWTKKEMWEVKDSLPTKCITNKGSVIFVSPVPFLLAITCADCMCVESRNPGTHDVYLFHNDHREKKEIGGKIINVVSQEGWELVKI